MCCIRYYMYRNGCEPEYAFGTDSHGYDLMLRLAGGLRLSLLLAVNLLRFLFVLIIGILLWRHGGPDNGAHNRIYWATCLS